jgi:cysteine-rich repeat protein
MVANQLRGSSVLLLLLLVMASCSSGTSIVLDGDGRLEDVKTGDVAVELTGAEVKPELVADVVVFDLGAELTQSDVVADLVESCQPGDGCFGDPCDEPGDCLSGWCVGHMGDTVCTDACVEECPDGWSCKEVSGRGPDVAFVCISNHANLCQPCVEAVDCQSPGVPDSACLSYGPDGAFCGAVCGAEVLCPDGFSCLENPTVDGTTVTSCVADAGFCDCSATAIALGLETGCQVINDLGSCSGQRACTAEGLSECSAPVPAEDVCNGLDDDCDGELDTVVCDDGNECTADECQGVDGCQFIGLDQTPCDDGDPCTVDICQQGNCVSTPIVCDDDNLCTEDVCVDGECQSQPNDLLCADGDPCTTADRCQDGECKGDAIDCNCTVNADCAILEDGDLCTGTLFCDTAKLPYTCKLVPDSLVSCPEPPVGPNAPCLMTVCDAETGECGFAPAVDGTLCDDANVCTTADKCVAGACVGGPVANCNDGNPCTDDSCDPVAGCVATNNTVACDDGDYCTVGDVCLDGACHPGNGKSCDDNNVCTVDTCDPATGCHNQPADGPCDDQNACTQGDACLAGKCLPGAAIDCDDGNVCTDDTCAPLQGCQHTNNSAVCDDGDACSAGDLCLEGTCQGTQAVVCDDSNPCTADSCDSNLGCVSVTDDGLTCDDQNPCTLGDHCLSGVCTATATDKCDDNNPCTDDACDPKAGCLHLANVAPCNDGDLCTTNDLCADEVCVGGEPLACNDDNVCTTDSCDAQTGCVFAALPSEQVLNWNFDDGTLGDWGFVPGEAGSWSAISYEDKFSSPAFAAYFGNPETHMLPSGLSEGALALEVTIPGNAIAPTLQFNYWMNVEENDCEFDNLFVLVDAQAVSKLCESTPDWQSLSLDLSAYIGQTVVVAFYYDSGDELFNVGQGVYLDDVSLLFGKLDACSDGNACTDGDFCLEGDCTSGLVLDCDDDNPCTTDSCDPMVGCLHMNNELPCNDGDTCSTGDTCIDGECLPTGELDCDDGNVCTDDSCDGQSGCVHEDNSLACDDQNDCTKDDVCKAGTCLGTGSLDCDDSNPCTKDTCLPDGGCAYAIITGACDDGDACTLNDTCSGGACQSGPQKGCDDGNPCTDDSCDNTGTCQHVSNADLCDDGNACTLNDYCSNGTCTFTSVDKCDDGEVCTTDSCNPLTGCESTNNSNPCNDGNLCTTLDVCVDGACVGSGSLTCNDGNPCTDDSCDGDTGCVYVANTDLCNDANVCTPTDVCSGGACVGSGSKDCNDSNSCTSDSCDSNSGCQHAAISSCCGNGIKESGEACDDGNQVSGDGCSSACAQELAVCSGIPNKLAGAMAACQAKFPNCVNTGSAGVIGYANSSCQGCNCDPVNEWQMFCYANAYDTYNCATCNLGHIQRSHSPCNCNAGTTPTIGYWCQ